jgi:LmbE family N-acetylglucosaminyl deacetylase
MSTKHLRLLAVFAHPDDESRIIGGTLAKYSRAGVHVAVWLATRGEASTLLGTPPICIPEELPTVRAREMAAAAKALGLAEVRICDYPDGALERVDQGQITGAIVRTIREVRPHVVITFGPEGRTLHPDHIAIHRCATHAFELAGDPKAYPEQVAESLRPWWPCKLYYTAVAASLARQTNWRFPATPDADITVTIDVAPYLAAKKRATIEAHRTQYAEPPFSNLDETARWRALSREDFVLAASRLPTQSVREHDLLAGIQV